VALVPSGDGLLVAGYRGGSDDNDGPAGNSQGFVRRLSAAGGLQWETVFDTPGAETVEALALGPDGTIYVAGRTTGALMPSAGNAGGFDAFVAILGLTAGSASRCSSSGDERPQHPRSISVIGTSLFLAGSDDPFIAGNAVLEEANPFTAGLSVRDAGITLDWWNKSRTPRQRCADRRAGHSHRR